MNILVVSDSHSIDTELVELLSYYRDKVDYIVHCGDSELSSQDTIWSLTDVVVKGNMDFDYGYSNYQVLQAEQHRIFVTHGHLFGVNYTLTDLALEAKANKAKIAFYGHTHSLKAQMSDGVLCVNPGSFNHSRGPVKERTFAIVSIEENSVVVRYYRADHTHITGLDKQFTIGS